MKKILLIAFIALDLLFGSSINTKQLIVVATQHIDANSGTLQRYEKVGEEWVKVGKSINVFVGRNGLGWGIGVHTTPANAVVVKKEGDGRAPMGLFRLKHAFGYEPFNVNYEYRVYGEKDHCVDDVNSKFYNSIVNIKEVTKDYDSFEYMKLNSDYYKYGVVVDHNYIDNSDNAVKGAGSCIFVHIKNSTTAGCTVMKIDEMKEIIGWLSKSSEPLLLQGTHEVVSKLLKVHNF